jgi:hypothetical protein
MFGDSGGNIVLATLSAEYDPDDHWSLRTSAAGSPSSTTDTSTTVSFATATGMTVDADAKLVSTAASASGLAAIGYDTAGEGALEGSFVASATATYFDTQQSITDVQGRKGAVVTAQQITNFCASHRCPPQLVAALAATTTHLVQYVADASATAQIYRDTDLSIDGAYYAYSEDPTKLGYYSVAANGRSVAGGGPSIAPLQYTAAPMLVHRFGGLLVAASALYGKYVADEGYDVTATLKVQYRWKLAHGRRFKLWGKVAGARDVDQDGTAIRSGWAALGAQYTF